MIGLSLGALGGGGSILAVPALVYVAGQDAKAATSTSLAIVGLVALVGIAPHWREGRVRFTAGALFGASGIGGSLLGSHWNRSADEHVLLLGFAGVMLIAAVAMWRRARREATLVGDGARATSLVVTTRLRADAATIGKVALAGSAVGLMTGFFGVGGGFVIVPALVLALRFPMPEAVGTALLVIAINAAVAFTARLGSGSVEWHVILPFTASGMLGVVAGSRVASRVAAERLVSWFAVFLVVVAAYMGVRSALAL